MESIPPGRLFAYNLSAAGYALADSLVVTFAVFFLLPPVERAEQGLIAYVSNETFLGVFTVLGLIMVFGRFVDAVADPLVARWSDSSHSSFGRRRTFLLAGGLPLALTAVLIFFPPVDAPGAATIVYLAAIFGAYFFFFTVYVGPYLALIPELRPTDQGRAQVTTVQGYLQLVGGGIALIGGPLLVTFLARRMSLTSAYRVMAIALAVIAALLMYAAVWAIDEKRYASNEPSSAPLWSSVRRTLTTGGFVPFLIGNLGLWFVFNILRQTALFVGVTLAGAEEAFAANMFVILMVSSAILFPLVLFLMRRVPKKTLMALGLAGFALFAPLLGLTGVIAVPARTWALLCLALLGFPVAVLFVVAPVLLSELCDREYAATGDRREAMYFGVKGFFEKLNLALASAVVLYLFSAYGKDIANPLGVRLALVAGAVGSVIGLVAITRYPERAGSTE